MSTYNEGKQRTISKNKTETQIWAIHLQFLTETLGFHLIVLPKPETIQTIHDLVTQALR